MTRRAPSVPRAAAEIVCFVASKSRQGAAAALAHMRTDAHFGEIVLTM
ncbi:MAG: hypothetical protein ACLQJR_16340 [Stellaceae bacterium]